MDILLLIFSVFEFFHDGFWPGMAWFGAWIIFMTLLFIDPESVGYRRGKNNWD
jgi:hypothetical protein